MAALPVDSFVANLLRQKESLASVDQNNVQCACGDEPAVCYCDECEEFIGESCLKGHSKMKKTSAHKPVKSTITSKQLAPPLAACIVPLTPLLRLIPTASSAREPCVPHVGSEHVSHQGVGKLASIATDFSGELNKSSSAVRSLQFNYFSFSIFSKVCSHPFLSPGPGKRSHPEKGCH